jgi:hypothetical protein
MVSHPGIDSEPWELIRGLASIEQPLLVAHFCQTIKIREYKWGKHDFHKEMLRDCKRRPLFPEPTGETLTWVLNQSYVALKENKETPKDITLQQRAAWFYLQTIPISNEAFRRYREQFCSPAE